MVRLPMTRRASILDVSQVGALVMPFQTLSQSRVNYAASNPLRNASSINKLFSLVLSSLHNALGAGQKSPSKHILTVMHLVQMSRFCISIERSWLNVVQACR